MWVVGQLSNKPFCINVNLLRHCREKAATNEIVMYDSIPMIKTESTWPLALSIRFNEIN